MSNFSYMMQGKNLVVVIDNRPHTIHASHMNYQKAIDAVKANDLDALKEIIDPKSMVINAGKGNIAVRGDKLYWKGERFDNYLAVKLIEMMSTGFPIDPMVAFMENLMENPSKRAVDELYKFLERGDMPITPDGHFLAYKKVNKDYMDIHSETVWNKPLNLMTDEEAAKLPLRGGKRKECTIDAELGNLVVSMDRNRVDDERNNTCSDGLHFCSESYLRHFSSGKGSDIVIIVKINPKDVVSIPSDYRDAKGRACRYEVIGVLEDAPDDTFLVPVADDKIITKKNTK